MKGTKDERQGATDRTVSVCVTASNRRGIKQDNDSCEKSKIHKAVL